jgi:hypothetical protein
MKNLRKFCAGFVLVIALSITAFGGVIECPVAADGTAESPGVAGDVQFPGITGDTQFPGVAGDMQFPLITGEIGFPGLTALFALLF